MPTLTDLPLPTIDDGSPGLTGVLGVPDGDGPWPGVLVAHEGPGLSDHERGVARRLAGLGYVAFALDYHGGGRPIADRDAMFQRVGELIGDPDQTRALGRGGLDALLAAPGVDTSRIAAIGYCFGGAMALELGPSGITVNAVCPGTVDTDLLNPNGMLQQVMAGAPGGFEGWVAREIPLGRLGAVDDVAAAVEFLAGDGAGYITGALVPVDGGLGMGH